MHKITLCVIPFLLLSVIDFTFGLSGNNLETAYEWKLLEYGFPTPRDRKQAISNGNLVQANGVPIDVAPYYNKNGKSKIFTTIPRFTTGIPYSLAMITGVLGNSGPMLMPYPNYEWHRTHGDNCDGITSAFRVAINECNQMWVIDSGVIGSDQLCPPQLLLFDLNTDQLLHRYRFNATLYYPRASLFIAPIIDVRDPPPRGRCQRTMIYVPDVSYHGVVVYDQQQNAAWRVESKWMHPDPNYGVHTIAGESFELMDGIFGASTDKKNLYFHPLASTSEYSVPLSVLDNRANWAEDPASQPEQFTSLGNRGSQCGAEAIDSRGNLYCVTFNPIRLFSWNVNSGAYAVNNFREVATDPQRLQFVSGMKVVKNFVGKEELWMLSNRFQKVASGTLNENEVNYRIVKRYIDDVQNGIDLSTPNLKDRLIFAN